MTDALDGAGQTARPLGQHLPQVPALLLRRQDVFYDARGFARLARSAPAIGGAGTVFIDCEDATGARESLVFQRGESVPLIQPGAWWPGDLVSVRVYAAWPNDDRQSRHRVIESVSGDAPLLALDGGPRGAIACSPRYARLVRRPWAWVTYDPHRRVWEGLVRSFGWHHESDDRDEVLAHVEQWQEFVR